MQPVVAFGASVNSEDGAPETCDITVADIIGPLKEDAGASGSMDRARDDSFSLLSYSFSLVGPGKHS